MCVMKLLIIENIFNLILQKCFEMIVKYSPNELS